MTREQRRHAKHENGWRWGTHENGDQKEWNDYRSTVGEELHCDIRPAVSDSWNDDEDVEEFHAGVEVYFYGFELHSTREEARREALELGKQIWLHIKNMKLT